MRRRCNTSNWPRVVLQQSQKMSATACRPAVNVLTFNIQDCCLYSILGLGLSLLSMEAVSGHLSAGLSPLQVRSRRWPRSWRDTLGLGCLGRICWWVRRGWRGELCSGHRSRFCGSQADTVGTSWTPSSAPSPGPAPRAGWSPWPAAGQTLKQIVSSDPPHNKQHEIFNWEKKRFWYVFPNF